MDKDQFIKEYCTASGITEKELLETQIVMPCKCGEEECQGWAVVSNNERSINSHLDLNI